MTPRSRRVHVNKLPRERDNTKMERADESVSDENNRAGGKCRPRATEAPGGCASGALETVREGRRRRGTGTAVMKENERERERGASISFKGGEKSVRMVSGGGKSEQKEGGEARSWVMAAR